MRRIHRFLSGASLPFVAVLAAAATDLPPEWRTRCIEEARLGRDDATRDDDFGEALAFDGNTLVSGVRLPSPGSGAAMVHVLEEGEWRLQALLEPSDPDGSGRGYEFPADVALHGDVLVLGRPGSELAGRDSGVVHVYERVGEDWFETAVLVPPDHAERDRFGEAVAVHGERILVGSPQVRRWSDEPDPGAADVFVRTADGWEHEARLRPSDAVDGHATGRSVALRGDRLAIGTIPSTESRPAAPEDHRVTLFERGPSGWEEVAELRPPDFGPEERFGLDLALGEDRILVGAPVGSTFGGPSGAGRVFEPVGGAWLQVAVLRAPPAHANHHDASAVALDGDRAVIGAPGNRRFANSHGAAQLFRLEAGEWQHVAELRGLTARPGSGFGRSVGLVGDRVAVGAPVERYGSNDGDVARVHVFRCRELQLPACGPEQVARVEGERTSGEAGRAVAIDGEWLAVGSPRERVVRLSRLDAGGSWRPDETLSSARSVSGDDFGRALALQGRTLVVGAPFHPELAGSAGAAMVFELSPAGTWSETAFLLAPDGEALDGFGLAVDVHEDTIVVGAHRDGDRGGAAGAAHVFVREAASWRHEGKLVADDGDGTEQLGYDVAVHGDVVIAGAHGEDDELLGLSLGAAYAYRRSGGTWTQEQKILAPEGTGGDQFGISVDVEGDTALIGSWKDGSGSAHVFRFVEGEWLVEDKLHAAVPTENRTLGTSVHLDGERAVLGDPTHEGAGHQAGAALVFVRVEGQWHEQGLLTALDAAEGERLGSSVGLSGDWIVAGAPLADGAAADAGRALVFRCESNRAPTCEAGADRVADCDGVALSGFAEDPDEDLLSVAWSTDCPGAVFVPSADVLDPVVVFGSSCAVGCTLRLNVTDERGLSCFDELQVSVNDSRAPELERPAPLTLECDDPSGLPIGDPRIAAWLNSVGAEDACSEVELGHDAPARVLPSCPGDAPTQVTFTARDACGNESSELSSLAIVDTLAPTLVVPEPLVLECDGPGGLPATDPRIAAWLGSAVAGDSCSSPALTHDAPAVFASGCEPGVTTRVLFTATDACGHRTSVASTLTLVDTTPPLVLRNEAVLGCVWPPNGSWVRFGREDAMVTVHDACDPAPPTWRFVDCPSDQPVDGLGDGHRAPDCEVGAGGDSFTIRAERSGLFAEGRTHSVLVVAVDGCGNVSEPELVGRVLVPHDRRPERQDCRSGRP